ncbi:MAG: hypothetical protein IAF94_22070 [Pirellulaceae bacterium]|nr:hypothetical protein [Pirellulaceae bacterium]
MKEPPATSSTAAGLRWAVYALLIALSAGSMTGRVLRVTNGNNKNPSPFLSANDRSRWCTIRALVDHGTYAIDDIIFDAEGNRIPNWHTIDLVKHRAADGQEHYYSSKPTLLPTLLAGEYWLIKNLTGATLETRLFYVARKMLLLTNVLPLVLGLLMLARILDKYGATDAGRIFVMACACGGTFLTTFSITLNNHLIGAVGVIATLAAVLPIWIEGRREWRYFILAGFCAAFTAANELPALAFFAAIALGLSLCSWQRTLIGFVPPALLITAAALGTNYLAHGTWKTPYAHRGDGPLVAAFPIPKSIQQGLNLKSQILTTEAIAELKSQGIHLSPRTSVEATPLDGRWVIFDAQNQMRYAATYPGVRRNSWHTEVAYFLGPYLELHAWDNWYEFDGSYWSSGELSSVDNGEPSQLDYAFHCLLGHHGVFSLTPIWLFSVWGLIFWFRSSNRSLAGLALMIAGLTVIVLLFYFTRPQIDRNYSGFSTCLRWLLWLVPLWLVVMLPAADSLAVSRLGWGLAIVLLAVSALSASYGSMNPWTHPWIFDYWTYLQWIEY